MISGKPLSAGAVAAALIALLAEAPAQADARISMLSDVTFGTLSTAADQTMRQNVCAYSRQGFTALGYGVRATGSGTGNAFTLASGARTLAYEVQWADAASQTAGTQLTANVLSPGYDNSALFNGCTFQTNGTATLIVIIRGTQAAAATAGNYTGTLQITIVPE
ncbi:MAG: hypothetical protein J7493_12625 [Porphyrobacter sp.]|nr:hypothetical protein [Porphyrobacter sp.]